MTQLAWRKEPPDKPGIYLIFGCDWLYGGLSPRGGIHSVEFGGLEQTVIGPAFRIDGTLNSTRSFDECQWAGPIEPPRWEG